MDNAGGWEKSWEAGATPWDLGGPTPIILHLSDTCSLPKGRTLVPGCGTGYDVVTMACPDRYVVGLDISKTVVEQSSKRFSSLPNAKYFSFLSEDFFTWEPAEKFDLIFDCTFFCTFEPSMRPLWGQRMEKLLKPDGELITLVFPIDERSGGGGPPYKVSVSEYENVLVPLGFEAICIADNQVAVKPHLVNNNMNLLDKPYDQEDNVTFSINFQGLEKIRIWKKKKTS
ncbi:unnamed protein product [Eruca vesicaria subsp. sativa]|uniref:Thiol methyltransferase 2 n=1 Tax=Eruca vesicaria subsp. sativa TaxID=29727 RepID=A0ABC8LJI6_ERUVS|nr:unnamed protein product [Eruca vesicaria subsp. sativa]